MQPSSSKFPPKMSSKIKKSITPQDLFEDLKSQMKLPQMTLPLIVFQLSKLISSKKESQLPLMKALLNPFFKEFLQISSIQEIKQLLENFLLYCEDNPKDELSLNAFLKLFSKVRFQILPNSETTLYPYMRFLENNIKIVGQNGNGPLNNNQITLLRLILTGFMNMASKIPEFKEQKCQALLQSFYTETHKIFFKVPVDIRLQQDFFLKFLMSLFRLLGYFLEKLPVLEKEQKLLETLLINLYKFMFLGTIFQKPIFGDLKEVSVLFTESNAISSSSEFSDLEVVKGQGSNKLDELYSKLRNYAALSMQNLIKLSIKALPPHWNKLLSVSVPLKEYQDFVRVSRIFNIQINIDFERKRLIGLAYKEPSLLFLLLNEKSSKVRINILNLVIQIVEGLPIKQWLAGFSAEKMEKHKDKKEAFLPISYQIFSSMRNLHWTLLILLLLEPDSQILCHILKILGMFINNYCYEKFTEDLKTNLFENFLLPLILMTPEKEETLKGFQEHRLAVQANSLACISGLLSLPTPLPKIAEKYLQTLDKTQNIISVSFKILDALLADQTKETEKFLFIIEALNLFSKIQKNHYISFSIFHESLIQTSKLFETTQNSLPKDIFVRINLCFSRLFEEISKAFSNPQNEEEFDEDATEGKKIDSSQNIPNLPKNFHSFLCLKVKKGLISDNVELIISSLNIFSTLKMDSFDDDDKKMAMEFLLIVENLLSKNASIKTAVFRTLGFLSLQKNYQKFFAADVFKILIAGAQNLQNVNAKIKNSWALACWLGCDEIFMLNIEDKKGEEMKNEESNNKKINNIQNISWKSIFSQIKELCHDGKEKVVCNGLRALGYFLKNISSDLFYQNFNEQNIKEVEIIITKRLVDNSAKIGLNASVSLKMISSSTIKEVTQNIFSNIDIYSNLLKILIGNNNMKNQVHALKVLAVIRDKTIVLKTFKETVKTLAELLKKLETFEESNPHYEEYRSQDTLKSLVLELLLSRILEESDDEFLIGTFLLNPTENIQIFELVNKMVHEIIKDKIPGLKDFDEKMEISEEEKMMTKGKLGKGVEIDEVPVKGEETLTVVRLDLNDKNKIRKKLEILKMVCQKFCHLIDSTERVAISFILYDTMKEYSEIEIGEGKDWIDIKVVKQGFFIDK